MKGNQGLRLWSLAGVRGRTHLVGIARGREGLTANGLSGGEGGHFALRVHIVRLELIVRGGNEANIAGEVATLDDTEYPLALLLDNP